jgi:hypothetical protein
MQIVANNNGSLREIMDDTLQDLRNANENNYLSAKVASGRNKLKVMDANKRGFIIALDYSTNPTGGYMSPTTSGATANLVTTYSPALDRMTCNYQYIQFGHELDNENLANSKPGLHVGASAKALAATKELNRRMEFEEWFFCRGDGTQIIGDITAGVSIAAAATGTLTLSGSRDGAGAWMLRVGQRIRIMDVTLATLRSYATVTAKTSNTAVSIVPDSNLTAGNAVVDTDVVLPESDTTLNSNKGSTTGIKGIPYIVNNTGGANSYFDKNRTSVPALQAIIDSSTTTFTRTTMEYLYRRWKSIRNNGSVNGKACTSPAQLSNYYAQFYAQNTAQVNIIGGNRPGVDIGGNGEIGQYTFWGQAIDEYKLYHPKRWDNLDFSSFYRLTLKEAGAMLTPAGEYVQKIASGAYVNAQQRWSDDYLEYLSPNPAKNSGFTALTFSGLPLLKDDPFVG